MRAAGGLGLVVLAACSAASPALECPQCPTCPPAVEDRAADPVPETRMVEPDEHRLAELPETTGTVELLDGVPGRVVTEIATLRVEPFEAPDASGEPVLHVRVHVQGPSGASHAMERSTALDWCDELYPGLQVVGGDEETLFVDVRLVCRVGEEVRRETIDHTVVRVVREQDRLDSSVLFTGTSRSRDNRGLAVESDRLEFHVEAGRLSVYRHRVAHCDREGLRTLMGDDFAGCTVRERTLQLVTRF